MNVYQLFRDGFANVVSALGANNAKVSANQYVLPGAVQYDPAKLENAYRTSTWFGKIVDIPADDATREWRSWKAGSKIIRELERAEKKLGVRGSVRLAMIWSRLYGGGLIVMGGLPGRPHTELEIDSVKRGDLKYLTVLSRHEVHTEGGLRKDPMDPYRGHPMFYRIDGDDGTHVLIHPSRVVRFRGRIVSSGRGNADEFWGDSIWYHMMDAVEASDGAAAVMAALMNETKVDVVKIPGFMDSLGTEEYERLLVERFRLAQVMKSVGNVLILDKEDEWEQKQIQWNGIPQVMESFLITMSGAADIPVTRLLGTSAKGLNATGEGDLKNYYDMVKARQIIDLDPALSVLDEVLIRSVMGSRDEEIWHEWIPLHQMTEQERVEADKTSAETVKIYAETGLLPERALAQAVANRMIESGRWPGLEQALEEIPEDQRWPSAERPDPEAAAEAAAAAAAEAGGPEGTGRPGAATSPAAPAGAAAGSARVDAADAAPRTLYVYRKVLNGDQILAWAREQGFRKTLPADQLHVTIMYSRKPVDWMKAGDEFVDWRESSMTVAEGGPRMVDRFGDARVLLFASSRLAWRHEHIKLLTDASWDHPEYQPHVTISYDPESPRVEDVVPYRGEIVLGPEIFEEIREDWQSGVEEVGQ